jgi:hypothetical protein
MNHLLKNWSAFSRTPHTAVWGSFKYSVHAVHEPGLREYPKRKRLWENPNREVGDLSLRPTNQTAARLVESPNRKVEDLSHQPALSYFTRCVGRCNLLVGGIAPAEFRLSACRLA